MRAALILGLLVALSGCHSSKRSSKQHIATEAVRTVVQRDTTVRVEQTTTDEQAETVTETIVTERTYDPTPAGDTVRPVLKAERIEQTRRTTKAARQTKSDVTDAAVTDRVEMAEERVETVSEESSEYDGRISFGGKLFGLAVLVLAVWLVGKRRNGN